LYLALRYREALNKIAVVSNTCPLLDIEFNKAFGFTKKLVVAVTGFFVFEGGNELSNLL
jgi:hypothetical protein